MRAGNGSGVQTVAMLTDMDSPIGKMIGNSLEVAESIWCMRGEGPKDLTDLVCRLGKATVVAIFMRFISRSGVYRLNSLDLYRLNLVIWSLATRVKMLFDKFSV